MGSGVCPLTSKPASDTLGPCDLGDSVKSAVPQFPHLVVGMNHGHTEQGPEHSHCSASLEATLAAAMPHADLIPGLLLQCSTCWVRHPWRLTHAGESLSSSHPGDQVIPRPSSCPPVLPDPSAPLLLHGPACPPEHGAEGPPCASPFTIPLLIHLLGHDSSLQRGSRDDVRVLVEKHRGEQITGKCSGNAREAAVWGTPGSL